MKKIFLLAVTVTTAFIANAQQEQPLVINAGGLKNLVLGNDMNVTLVRSQARQADVKGATAVFGKLNVSVRKTTMHIHSRASLQKGENVVVVVDGLESLTLGQNTQVKTEGLLYATETKVFVETGSVARLRTTGTVSAFSLDDADVKIERLPVKLNMDEKVM